MGNHHQRGVLANGSQRLLNSALCAGVNIGRGLVQNQHLRGVHQHAGQRQQLLLPDGEIIPLLAQMGVKAVAHAANHFRQLHRFQHLPDLLFTNLAPQRNVGEEGVSQHYRILLHHRDALTQHLMTEARQWPTAEADLSRVRRVVPHEQAGQRTFTAPGMPHQRHEAARRNRQRDVLQHHFVVAVSERHVVDINIPARQRSNILPILLTRPVHQLKNAFPGDYRLLQHRLLGRQLNQRFIEASQVADKCIQHTNLDRPCCAKAK